MCAEGASLPLRGADAEMERPGDHYTFGPIVSEARPRKRRNKSTPTCQHTGTGPCERMDRNPRNSKVKERERKEKKKRMKGKKHENKPTNIVPLGRLNAAEIAATTKEKASLEASQPRQTKKRADRQREKDKGRTCNHPGEDNVTLNEKTRNNALQGYKRTSLQQIRKVLDKTDNTTRSEIPVTADIDTKHNKEMEIKERRCVAIKEATRSTATTRVHSACF